MSKNQQKIVSLNLHVLREKSIKTWKNKFLENFRKFLENFRKFSDFLKEFPELKNNENTEKPASLKVDNLHVFRENSCTFSKEKKEVKKLTFKH